MAQNPFESGRISEGTLPPSGQQVTPFAGGDRESMAISRDDVRDGFDSNKSEDFPERQAKRRVLSAGTLTGERVVNPAGETLGSIEEIMVDIESGDIAYAVLSFGGFLGIGEKLFAVPWKALKMDQAERQFILNMSREDLDKAPGFDKDNWPDMADPAFGLTIHQHYGRTPYWEHTLTAAGDYPGDNPTPDRSSEFDTVTGYAPAQRH
jgi:sporulation protein YlmC with PRC-barrel domain